MMTVENENCQWLGSGSPDHFNAYVVGVGLDAGDEEFFGRPNAWPFESPNRSMFCSRVFPADFAMVEVFLEFLAFLEGRRVELPTVFPAGESPWAPHRAIFLDCPPPRLERQLYLRAWSCLL
jgi:hypothetical protein